MLLLLNYSLLYLDFNNACCKDYNGRVEKCIVYLAIIYQGFYQIEIWYKIDIYNNMYKTDLEKQFKIKN